LSPAQIAFSTSYRTLPYITSAEYRAAPTGVDTSDLVPGGQAVTEDQVLADVISGASGWVDVICDQVLAATVDLEARRLRTRQDGTLVVHPDNWPVLEVRDLQYGPSPTGLTQLTDLSGIWVEERQFVLVTPGVQTSQGPLQLGGLLPGQRLLVRYTYVNGWPNTLLAAPAAAGATSVTVGDTTGTYPADPASGRQATRLVLDTGSLEETVTVTGTPTGGNVPVSALGSAHQAGVRCSALPPVVKQAAILLTSALIKTRGSEALVMDALGGLPTVRLAAAEAGPGGRDVADAKELLRSFARDR